MSDGQDSALQRFVRDLRRIREEYGVTVEEIHETTQVSTSQIESFERGDLFGQARMSRVYLRAFARSYADVIGLSPDEVAAHLESALEGTYNNNLADRYLKGSSSVDESGPSFDIIEVPSSDSGSVRDEETADSTESGRRGAMHSSQTEKEGQRKTPEKEAYSEQESLVGSEAGSSPGRGTGSSTSASQGLNRESSGSFSFGRTGIEGPLQVLFPLGGKIVDGAVLLAMLGAYCIAYLGGETGAMKRTPFEPDSRSPSKSIRVSSDSRPSNPLVIGDTLHLTILATSKVQAMRVTRDQDLRRPYWIEVGRAKVFPFTEQIIVDEELDDARLFLEQYPYSTAPTDSLGRVVIDRRAAKAFADTLTGSRAQISARPDTIAIRNRRRK